MATICSQKSLIFKWIFHDFNIILTAPFPGHRAQLVPKTDLGDRFHAMMLLPSSGERDPSWCRLEMKASPCQGQHLRIPIRHIYSFQKRTGQAAGAHVQGSDCWGAALCIRTFYRQRNVILFYHLCTCHKARSGRTMQPRSQISPSPLKPTLKSSTPLQPHNFLRKDAEGGRRFCLHCKSWASAGCILQHPSSLWTQLKFHIKFSVLRISEISRIITKVPWSFKKNLRND